MALQAATRIVLKEILLATDFSAASEAALPYALAIAHRFESKIHVVHVMLPGKWQAPPEAMPLGFVPARIAEAKQRMSAFLRSGNLTGVVCDWRIQQGSDIWEELSKTIQEEKIDLVVLGTHGREGLKKLLLGSVAEEVFRRAHCPVLTVGPKAAGKAADETPFRHMLFATDLTPESLKAVPFVLAFAEEHQAHLTVVHVPQGEKVHSHEGEVLLAESTGKWLREMIPPQANLEYAVRFGAPAEAILKLATEKQCDLVLLGAHPAPGYSMHLPGAVAHRIVAEAHCPVLTVHHKEKA